MMHTVNATNIVLDYPLYGAENMSLRKRVLSNSRIISTKKFPVIRALNDVSFTAFEGDRIGLLGNNGAGKSSLLKVISGVYQPNQGSIEVKGKAASLLDITLPISNDLTGYENIRLCALMLGCDYKDIAETSARAADLSGLGDYLNLPLYAYSGGMRMRLAFAVATCMRAEILLMDEHFGAVDQGFIRKAEKQLHSIIEQSKTLFFTSHNTALVKEICNKAIVLDQGKILGMGGMSEMLDLYASIQKEYQVQETDNAHG